MPVILSHQTECENPENFYPVPRSSLLLLSDYVDEDGNLTSTGRHDKDWKNRDTSDSTTYENGTARRSLSSSASPCLELMTINGRLEIPSTPTPDHGSNLTPFDTIPWSFWKSGRLRRVCYTHYLYRKGPSAPEAWHTKQNVHLVGFK
ncbi:hypothetical protein FA13DRAFT_1735897 [Coprinellus micaceus]|uniref:Uncharacterized protein n=1 Tax=Coprinellus micaceus TaxID=71717 RepID=A0A4Y7T3Y3_COPMI|nr:hypothetical protein FA13DRAFT_1735897 [Coprinellus micaceus]